MRHPLSLGLTGAADIALVAVASALHAVAAGWKTSNGSVHRESTEEQLAAQALAALAALVSLKKLSQDVAGLSFAEEAST